MKKQSSSLLRSLLIALGSAVGLANIWGFPYKFHSGGLVFLIFFIVFIGIFAVFGLSSELALGRLSKKGTLGAYEYSFKSSGKSQILGRYLGYIPLIGAFLIAIGYCSILAYIFKGLIDSVTGEIFHNPSEIWFDSFATVPHGITIYHGIIVLLAIWLCLGHRAVIKNIYRSIMPIFFIVLGILAIKIGTMENASQGYRHMFTYNPDTLHLKTILYAMGEAFFSLSMAGSWMISVGATSSEDEDLVNLSIKSAIFDTLVGIIASLAIIPALNIFNMEEVGGASLIFETLPAIFANIKFGQIIAIFFYLSIVFAGINSISNMFVAISTSITNRHEGLPKKAVLLFLGLAVFLLGLGLETIDKFTWYMNLMLLFIIPIGASIGAITCFYVLKEDKLLEEVNKAAGHKHGKRWYNMGRYLYVPLAILLTIISIIVQIIH